MSAATSEIILAGGEWLTCGRCGGMFGGTTSLLITADPDQPQVSIRCFPCAEQDEAERQLARIGCCTFRSPDPDLTLIERPTKEA